MQISEFLRTVVTSQEGHFCLATRKDTWKENWYSWPNDLDKIVAHAESAKETETNVYFSAHLFSERSSKKQYVLPSRTIQADLDHAEIGTIPITPTLLVQTSPGRHQGYWITERPQAPDKLEALGRRIAYGVIDCDKTGWPVGHKVRLPGTNNLKYSKPHLITVAGINLRPLDVDSFNMFPDEQVSVESALADIEWVDEAPEKITVPALEILAALKGKINPRAWGQYTKPAKDRSAALWLLNCECLKAGITRDQTYHLALNSANNKFEDRKYNGVRDLRLDILRAEKYVGRLQLDLKALIMDLRHNKGELVAGRRKKMAELVINHMRQAGEFVHTKGGTLWFLRKDTGRPIILSSHSEWLNAYLANTFGLNYTEVEFKYCTQEIITYTRSLPVSNDLKALSYYDTYRDTLLLHTGGRDVLHISKSGIEVHPNGYGNIVFQWGLLGETFSYTEGQPLSKPWWEVLFDGCLNNLIGIERDEAIAALRSWFLFLLLRNLATTRPILALYGTPGSGKTTTAKLFYRLIYGHYKSVSGLSDSEDFDMECSSVPFVCFDNLDTWQPWLPDRLAQCAGNTSITRRKLYTDMDMVYLERQALVAVTAHAPKFAREDITDRLILLTFQRLTNFRSETEILDKISDQRNDLWAAIIKDIQNILNTPKPPWNEVPQFRIEDFARLGYWFAKAAGPKMASDFTSAILKIQGRQRSFNIEQDYTLVSALQNWIAKRPDVQNNAWLPVSVLWTQLCSHAPDTDSFKKQYRNMQLLNNKLYVMQESLKSILSVEVQTNPTLGARVWKIGAKNVE